MHKRRKDHLYVGRHWLAFSLIMVALFGLLLRAAQLQWLEADYLQAQGESRYLREVVIKPNRGRILDRQGEVVAISTPVDSVWAHPGLLLEAEMQWPRLAESLGITVEAIRNRVAGRESKEFVYLKRHLTPEDAATVLALRVPGVDLQREYRRYYPAGPIAGQLIGFTDIDDRGQEGVEKAFDFQLRGAEGRKRILRDRLGHVVENVESIRRVHHGSELQLSIDLRVQELVRRSLGEAVSAHRADGGSAVVLDARSGEVLAMASVPDFNPNDRAGIANGDFRNRVVADVLEPGSTVKPFTVSMALTNGIVGAESEIDTSPGIYYVSGRPIRDIHDYGRLSVSKVLVKSSNIGAVKIAMLTSPEQLLRAFRSIGYGSFTGIELPGERSGTLIDRDRWRPIEHATLSYGYGVAVTPLQLARSYAVLANDGVRVPLTILKRDRHAQGERVIPKAVVREINGMLERVVSPEGTARRAVVPMYRVAGKTGTVRKLGPQGYLKGRYLSLFSGFGPMSDPRYVVVVVVDDPRGKEYYGGQVAAPVFSDVMAGLFRLYNLSPDQGTPVRQIVANPLRAESGV